MRPYRLSRQCQPAHTRGLTLARLGLLLCVAISLAGCVQTATAPEVPDESDPRPAPPTPPGPYALTGELESWTGDAPTLVLALANPNANEELELASAAVDANGSFRLVLDPPDDALLTPLTTLFPDTSACSERYLRPAAASLLFVSRYRLAGSTGDIVADVQRISEPREDGVIVSETHVFSTAATRIAARCTFDRSAFEFDLDLAAGWNAYRLHTPSTAETPYRLTSEPAGVALAWRARPEPTGAATRPQWALESLFDMTPTRPETAWPWLRRLVSPADESER